MNSNSIVYEQPLTELIRLCLRLENLFARLDVTLQNDPESQTQTIMALLIDIINVLDRPDLKNKFGKEFYRLINVFSKLHEAPGISTKTLNDTINSLKTYTRYFVNVPGKIAHSLKEHELLSTIRQNFTKLGGSSVFEVPSYFYWLQQPWEIREKNIQDWIKTLDEIRASITLLLNITRNSSESRNITAKNGFYHETLDPHNPCHLIRIALPHDQVLYPEVSAGKHGLSIRFVIPSPTERPKQTKQSLSFQLTTCTI